MQDAANQPDYPTSFVTSFFVDGSNSFGGTSWQQDFPAASQFYTVSLAIRITGLNVGNHTIDVNGVALVGNMFAGNSVEPATLVVQVATN